MEALLVQTPSRCAKLPPPVDTALAADVSAEAPAQSFSVQAATNAGAPEAATPATGRVSKRAAATIPRGFCT
jgi:hypothetical protein